MSEEDKQKLKNDWQKLKNDFKQPSTKGALLFWGALIILYFLFKQCSAPTVDSATFKLLKTSDLYDINRKIEYSNIYFGVDENGKFCSLALAKEAFYEGFSLDIITLDGTEMHSPLFSIDCQWHGRNYTGDSKLTALKLNIISFKPEQYSLSIRISAKLSHKRSDEGYYLFDFEPVTIDISGADFLNLKL